MIPTNLPPQFMCWKLVQIPGRKKPDKVPCLPVQVGERAPGTVVDAHDPRHWSEYEIAQRAVESGVAQGVAFVLTENDSWFFLDLDNCYDAPSEDWNSEAKAIYQLFVGAWGEVSQSGNGLHIMGYCDKNKLKDRRSKWDGWKEFYINSRFIAFGSGGWSRIGGISEDYDHTENLLKIVPQKEFIGELPDGVDPAYTGPSDDEELLKLAMRSRNTANAFGQGVSFEDLWTGDVDKLSQKWPSFNETDPFDRSSADMALMCQLSFWTGNDMPRMDRLFRRSALMRNKYEERPAYRTETIQKAARLTTKVYDVPRNDAEGDNSHKEELLSIYEQQEFFAGCVYVRDQHRVFVPDGALLRPDQFNAMYGGHRFVVASRGTPSKKAFEAFTENCLYDFPKVTTTRFVPNEEAGSIRNDSVNTYVKPEIEKMSGSISPIEDFMRRLLPNEEDRAILINYLAAAVQHPGVKFQWAPVLQGTEGNGKTLLATCLAYAIGEQYVHSPRASQLAEKFNGYIDGKMLIIVEEIHMGGRREMLDELKPLVTNGRIEIRQMHAEKRMIDNVANWFFCTNHRDAVLKSRNDRRYAIFFTAQQSYEDIVSSGMGGDYFPKLYAWLRDGGYAYVAHWLENYPIREDLNPAGKCHRAPRTSSTDVAIEASIGPIEQEIQHAVETDRLGFRGGWISSKAFDVLMDERRMKVSRNKIRDILESLGYRRIGRASKPVSFDGGDRPVLWYKGMDDETTDAYIASQQGVMA